MDNIDNDSTVSNGKPIICAQEYISFNCLEILNYFLLNSCTAAVREYFQSLLSRICFPDVYVIKNGKKFSNLLAISNQVRHRQISTGDISNCISFSSYPIFQYSNNVLEYKLSTPKICDVDMRCHIIGKCEVNDIADNFLKCYLQDSRAKTRHVAVQLFSKFQISAFKSFDDYDQQSRIFMDFCPREIFLKSVFVYYLYLKDNNNITFQHIQPVLRDLFCLITYLKIPISIAGEVFDDLVDSYLIPLKTTTSVPNVKEQLIGSVQNGISVTLVNTRIKEFISARDSSETASHLGTTDIGRRKSDWINLPSYDEFCDGFKSNISHQKLVFIFCYVQLTLYLYDN